jgi:hypothetical protein
MQHNLSAVGGGMVKVNLIEAVLCRQWEEREETAGVELMTCRCCGGPKKRTSKLDRCAACKDKKRSPSHCAGCGGPMDIRSVTRFCRSCWLNWKPRGLSP